MSPLELILITYSAAITAALVTSNAMWIQREETTISAILAAIVFIGFSGCVFFASVAATMAVAWVAGW